MTSKEFQSLRLKLNMSQQQLASRLGITQKHVSLLETGKVSIPPLMSDALKRGLRGAIVDDQFSLPFHVHEFLWNRANTRAGAVSMSCWIKPSDAPGFGEIRAEIRFEGLETCALGTFGTGDGDGLILDLFSNPNGPKGPKGQPLPSPVRLGWPEDESNVFPKEVRAARPEITASRAKCTFVSRDYKVIYRIWDADGYEPVVVNLYCKEAFTLDVLDTVGFPLYPDLVIERLSFRVSLHNLVCEDPELPPFTPFLIRRANERAVPANLRSQYAAKSEKRSKTHNVFTFGPLLRPASGFIYGLTWTKLVPTAASSRRK